jgi:hypothetical protein
MPSPSGQLIYNPQIEVLIDTTSNGIINVSSDIISFSLNRITNGVSTFSCTLNNKNKKYTINYGNGSGNKSPVIETLNRIVVNLTRTNKLQVFSGYVNVAPILTILPNAIQIEAKCTLKRLQDTFWDSSIQELRNILPGVNSKIQGNGAAFEDGGAAKGMANLLADVVGWDPKQMYFGQIPEGFLNLAALSFKDASKILDNALLTNLKAAVDSYGVSNTGTSGAGSDGFKGTKNGNGTNYEWAAVVLSECSLPVTQNNINNMVRWMVSEHPAEKWWVPDLKHSQNNPLSIGPADNYPNLSVAATKTANTIAGLNGFVANYTNDIVAAFKNDVPFQQFVKALKSSKWDAEHYPNGIPEQLPPAVAVPPESGGNIIFSSIANTVVAAAISKEGTDYAWGGGNSTGPTRGTGDGANTIGFDCSGLCQYAYAQAGITIPRTSQEQWTSDTTGPQYVSGTPLPGDLLFWGGNPPTHVTLCLQSPDSNGENGLQIEAQKPNTQIKQDNFNTKGMVGFKRPWALGFAGTNTNGTSAQNADNSSNGANTNTLGLFNTVYILPQYNSVARQTFGSPRGFVMDEPVLNSISQLSTASFRHFQSLGTGEFMSWFPDYFGLYGTPAAWQIYNIEITDLTIYHNDDPLTTHVAVVGDTQNIGKNVSETDWLSTQGIISVQSPNIITMLFGEEIAKNFDVEKFMIKYGMRPYVTTQPLITNGTLEFSSALMTFMNMWAQQYSTQVGFTFMPELFPGIRIQFPDIIIEGEALECYVSNVTHEGDMKNGFITKATLTAPSAGGKLLYLGLS